MDYAKELIKLIEMSLNREEAIQITLGAIRDALAQIQPDRTHPPVNPTEADETGE